MDMKQKYITPYPLDQNDQYFKLYLKMFQNEKKKKKLVVY